MAETIGSLPSQITRVVALSRLWTACNTQSTRQRYKSKSKAKAKQKRYKSNANEQWCERTTAETKQCTADTEATYRDRIAGNTQCRHDGAGAGAIVATRIVVGESRRGSTRSRSELVLFGFTSWYEYIAWVSNSNSNPNSTANSNLEPPVCLLPICLFADLLACLPLDRSTAADPESFLATAVGLDSRLVAQGHCRRRRPTGQTEQGRCCRGTERRGESGIDRRRWSRSKERSGSPVPKQRHGGRGVL
mmetsp:Transcript_28292/g.66430  ORF Transcript_28292/g.66430 Transcript_28292/m.66430 type:complete len:248 (+) Transcript_28292:270-1013(+)